MHGKAFSNDQFGQVVRLGLRGTSIPVGAGRAVVVVADGVVRDDSRIGVFEAASGLVAIVQATGPTIRTCWPERSNPRTLGDEDGDTLKASSGGGPALPAGQGESLQRCGLISRADLRPAPVASPARSPVWRGGAAQRRPRRAAPAVSEPGQLGEGRHDPFLA
jgi:hypothetical protein